MYTCDIIFYFKRNQHQKVESILITTTSSISKKLAETKMGILLNKAEKENNPSILLGKDIKDVSSLWF